MKVYWWGICLSPFLVFRRIKIDDLEWHENITENIWLSVRLE